MASHAPASLVAFPVLLEEALRSGAGLWLEPYPEPFLAVALCFEGVCDASCTELA